MVLAVSEGLQFENDKLSAGVSADACLVSLWAAGEQVTGPGCVSEVIAADFAVMLFFLFFFKITSVTT